MGVQRHDSYPGFYYPEVFDKRAAHRLQVADDFFFRDVAADFRDRDVLGHKSDAQYFAAHDHQRFPAQLGTQIFRVARVAEFVALYRLLVERRCHQGVQIAVLEVLHRTAQCFHCCPACFGRCLPRFYAFRFSAVHYADFAAAGFMGRCDRVKCCLGRFRQRLAVIVRRFGRAVDDRGADFGHAGVRQRFEYDFPADSVRVALGDSYLEFVFRHGRSFFSTNIR